MILAENFHIYSSRRLPWLKRYQLFRSYIPYRVLCTKIREDYHYYESAFYEYYNVSVYRFPGGFNTQLVVPSGEIDSSETRLRNIPNLNLEICYFIENSN